MTWCLTRLAACENRRSQILLKMLPIDRQTTEHGKLEKKRNKIWSTRNFDKFINQLPNMRFFAGMNEHMLFEKKKNGTKNKLVENVAKK